MFDEDVQTMQLEANRVVNDQSRTDDESVECEINETSDSLGVIIDRMKAAVVYTSREIEYSKSSNSSEGRTTQHPQATPVQCKCLLGTERFLSLDNDVVCLCREN